MLHYMYAIFGLTASILFLIFGGLIAFKSVFAKSRLTGRPTGSPLFDQNSNPRASGAPWLRACWSALPSGFTPPLRSSHNLVQLEAC